MSVFISPFSLLLRPNQELEDATHMSVQNSSGGRAVDRETVRDTSPGLESVGDSFQVTNIDLKFVVSIGRS